MGQLFFRGKPMLFWNSGLWVEGYLEFAFGFPLRTHIPEEYQHLVEIISTKTVRPLWHVINTWQALKTENFWYLYFRKICYIQKVIIIKTVDICSSEKVFLFRTGFGKYRESVSWKAFGTFLLIVRTELKL